MAVKSDRPGEPAGAIAGRGFGASLVRRRIEVNLALQGGGAHGAFTWGETPEKAVYNAVVLEELARMAFVTHTLDPSATRLPERLIRKHFERKHGKDRYYGQK